MKRLIQLLFIQLLLVIAANTHAQDQYISSVDQEFEKLESLLNKAERVNWDSRFQDARMAVIKKTEEMESINNYLKSRSDYEEIKSVRAFSYLKEVNYASLESKTNLVEELGRFLFEHKLQAEVIPLTVAIEKELEGMQNAQGALQLQSKLVEYFKIKRQIEVLSNNVSIKTEYQFRPQENAWDSDPKLVKTFILHDWFAAMAQLDSTKESLQSLKDSFVSFNYLKLRDPLAFVSIAAQLAVLLVTVAGYMISFTKKPSIRVVSLLVLSSMTGSLVLIFVSSSTLLNLIMQAFIPAGFIIKWVLDKKNSADA